MNVHTPLALSLRRVLAAMFVSCLAFVASGVVASSAGAVQPQVDIAGEPNTYLTAVVNSDGSVQARKFSCKPTCIGSAWVNLGGYVTSVKVHFWQNSYYIVGRGGDGFVWYRSATCTPDSCSFSSWIRTGGSGYDIQIVDPPDLSGCPQVAVIGNDGAVWVASICPAFAGGWVSLGGRVVDIDYTGFTVYGVDSTYRLWRQARGANGRFGNWSNLGGYVRWPVEMAASAPYRVAVVGGDSNVWTFTEGIGWAKMANGENIGYMSRRSQGAGELMIITTDFAGKRCSKNFGLNSLFCYVYPSAITSGAAWGGAEGRIAVGIDFSGSVVFQRGEQDEPDWTTGYL